MEKKNLNSFEISKKAYFAAINEGNPEKTLKRILPNLISSELLPTFILALGKAAPSMAETVRKNKINAPGILITNDENFRHVENFLSLPTGHPYPDHRGLKASKKVEGFLRKLNSNDHILILLSGGGSALMPAPPTGISLNQKIFINEVLLSSGLNIHKVNAVRRLFSRLKGGRLAELAYPAKITQLILSDVPGDNLETIASGISAPDPVPYSETISIIKNLGLLNKDFISKYIEKIEKGSISKPLEKSNKIFDKVKSIILASNKLCVKASNNYLKKIIHNEILCPPILDGNANLMGQNLCHWLVQNASQKRCFAVTGGETTVKLDPTLSGLGGRCQELALSFAVTMKKQYPNFKRNWLILSAGTDGKDGPTEAAGAILTSEIKFSLSEALLALKNHDSYNFNKKLKTCFITNGTDTNLGDLVIIIVN